MCRVISQYEKLGVGNASKCIVRHRTTREYKKYECRVEYRAIVIKIYRNIIKYVSRICLISMRL